MSKDNITDIAVIGGGASGFAAAIEAKTALPKAKVVILEKLDRVGRKILATGNGRCNLSNINLSADHYHGSVKNVMRIIGATPSAKEFFGSIGVICTADTKGRIYPKSNSAATVLSALRLRAEELCISERCNFEATFIESTNDGFRIHSASGEKYPCRRVIVAAGGYAAPQFGTDGSVIRLLRSKGCHTTKICPAVAPLRVRPELLKGLKGVRAKGRVMAYSAGRLLKEEVGEIQFTDNALSGICVFNMAHLFSQYEGKLKLRLDLAADMDAEQLEGYLRVIQYQRSRQTTEELLTGIFPRNLSSYITKRALGKPLTVLISELRDSDLRQVVQLIKCLEFDVTGTAPWKDAQVTSGGISGECVDERLQLRSEKGIFLCGEILDVDGDCGGYNLQWAWSSGILAGRSCADSLRGGLS
ncbi:MULTISPECIES: aminoacetone oxidase family FAD-binding enzyme [Ruminococcus]|mgnify:CR=1 FL=1|uniref:aminoacetone oxidase family FAD-binding enzyme n=1 Tax=Ruminococcus TaxID=1263 RepID=UPI00048B93BF|nr:MULTISPECIES: aminoacetone oxidase family FAD-binding enzyme [Ruminococcus]HNZ98683.1 aminoacetone oxidase family FAD-binding enzyme [Ruminococcus sp.]HOH86473.1 aminoacetone oxidase family FAD-binding enzyme [Ruminococcus sp.]